MRHVRGGSARQDPGRAQRAYRASQLAFYAKHRSRLSQFALRFYLELKYGLQALLGNKDAATMRALVRNPKAADSSGAPCE